MEKINRAYDDYITTDTSNDHRYVDIEDIITCCRTGDLLLMKGKKIPVLSEH